MANVQKTIEVIFAGTDKLSGTIGGIAGSVNDFAGDIDSAIAPFQKFTQGVLALEVAVLALGAAFAGKALKEFSTFESAQLDLQKVLKETDGDVGQFTDTVFELSNKYGESAAEILQSTANFKQAGFEASEAIGLVVNSLDLVVAGDLEAAEASDLIIASLKGFKAPAEDAARLVDILNEVSNEYATSAGELAKGMARLSPIANQVGFSFEETAGILTPVIEVFRSGDEAANALKTGLLKLIDDTGSVEDALSRLGVAQKDSNGELRSAKDILRDVSLAFGDADQNSKLFLAQQLVGIHQAGKMVEVFDGLAKSTDVTTTALGAQGSAAKEVDIRLGSLEKSLDRSKVAFNNLAAVTGAQFQSNFKGIVDSFTEIEKAIQSGIEGGALDELFNALAPYSKEIEDLFLNVASNIEEVLANLDFSGVIGSFETLAGTGEELFGAVFGDFDLNTAQGLTEFLQQFVDGFEALNNTTAGVIAGITPVVGLIREIFDVFVNLDPATQKLIGQFSGFAASIGLLTAPLGLVALGVKGLSGTISTFAGLGTFVVNFEGFAGALNKLVPTLQTAVPLLAAFSAGFAVGDALYKNSEGLRAAADATAEWVGELLGGVDIQEELAKVTQAGTQLTEEQIEAYRKLHPELEKIPTDITTTFQITDETEASTKEVIEMVAADEERDFYAKLRVAPADGASEGLIDWSLHPEVQKLIKIDVDEADQKAVDQYIKEVTEGKHVISFPSTLEYDPTAEEKAYRDIQARWAEVGLSFKIPELEDEFKQMEVVARDTFDGIGGRFQKLTDEFGKTRFEFIADGTNIPIEADKAIQTLDELKDKILEKEESIEAALKFQAEVETQKYEEDTKRIIAQTGALADIFKFKAEVDVAEAEASAKKIVAISDSISEAFTTSGEIITEAFGILSDVSANFGPHSTQMNLILESIRSEIDLRQKEVEIQARLADSEIAYNNAKTDSLLKGDALIRISADGLEPELEAFMWAIVQKIQIRAAANEAEFLLGLE